MCMGYLKASNFYVFAHYYNRNKVSITHYVKIYSIAVTHNGNTRYKLQLNLLGKIPYLKFFRGAQRFILPLQSKVKHNLCLLCLVF